MIAKAHLVTPLNEFYGDVPAGAEVKSKLYQAKGTSCQIRHLSSRDRRR